MSRLLCWIGWHHWIVLTYGTHDNVCKCSRCGAVDIR